MRSLLGAGQLLIVVPDPILAVDPLAAIAAQGGDTETDRNHRVAVKLSWAAAAGAR